MKIILLGKMGAGKDTVADYLRWKYDFYCYAFADKLKKIAIELFPEKCRQGKPRKLLQVLGQMMREIDVNCWTNYLLRQIEKDRREYGIENIVITDGRYRNELDLCKQHGFFPVKVVCDDIIRLQRLRERDGFCDPTTFNHASETDLDEIEGIYELDNNGSKEELYRRIDKLIEVIQEWRANRGSQTA